MEIHAISDYWIIISFFALVLVYKLYRRRIKGFIGERDTAVRLAQLNKLQYKFINNLADWIYKNPKSIDLTAVKHKEMRHVKYEPDYIYGLSNYL